MDLSRRKIRVRQNKVFFESKADKMARFHCWGYGSTHKSSKHPSPPKKNPTPLNPVCFLIIPFVPAVPASFIPTIRSPGAYINANSQALSQSPESEWDAP